VKAVRRAKWLGIAAALLLAFDASAQGQSGPPSDRSDGAGPPRMGQGPHRQQRARGEGPGLQGMAPTARPAQFAADDAAAPRGGPMSKEERRQLRRDVHDAGRDIYPERRRAGQRELPPQ
jgi:hypothetical protein